MGPVPNSMRWNIVCCSLRPKDSIAILKMIKCVPFKNYIPAWVKLLDYRANYIYRVMSSYNRKVLVGHSISAEHKIICIRKNLKIMFIGLVSVTHLKYFYKIIA